MEVKFYKDLHKEDKQFNLENFKDVRFVKDDKNALSRRINRIPGEDDISAIVFDDNIVVAIFVGSTNIWNGLKTIFCNGLLINKKVKKDNIDNTLSFLLTDCIKNAKQSNYEKFLIETDKDNPHIANLLSTLKMLHKRVLINYTINKDDLIKNTTGAIKKIEKNGFKITEGDINNLTPYLGFMDTRPGWLTSNASMNKKAGDKLITIRTAFDTVSAIAIFNPDTGIISRIATMPLSRTCGFGTALLSYISSHTNVQTIQMVDINKKNEEAHSFLTNRGFSETMFKDELTFDLT